MIPCTLCGQFHDLGSPCPTVCDAQEEQGYAIDRVIYVGALLCDSFNFPAIGETVEVANVVFDAKIAFPLGAFIFSAGYGYLQAVGYDGFKLTLLNTGVVSNKPPGSFVPAGVPFIFVDLPYDATGSLTYPYVAENFAIPAIGACKVIAVTSIAGLSISQLYILGAGTYRIAQIPDGRHIQICNDGGGAAANTSIVAKDVNGNFQYPITISAVSPCTMSAAHGSLLICSNGAEKQLDGFYPGQVPVLGNSSSNDVAFQFLDTSVRTCALLLQNVFLQANIAGYIFNIQSTAGLAAGDQLQADFSEVYRFTIGTIQDASHVAVTCFPVPTIDSVISAGSYVCKILQIEALQTQIAGFLTTDTAFKTNTNIIWDGGISSGPNEIDIKLSIPSFPGYVDGHIVAFIPNYGLDIERSFFYFTVNSFTPQRLTSYGIESPRPIRRREIRAGCYAYAVYSQGQYWLLKTMGDCSNSAISEIGIADIQTGDFTGVGNGAVLYSNSSDEVEITLTAQLEFHLAVAGTESKSFLDIALYIDGIIFPGKVWRVTGLNAQSFVSSVQTFRWITTPPAGTHTYQVVARCPTYFTNAFATVVQSTLTIRRFPVN